MGFSPHRLRESLSAILDEAGVEPASCCVALSGGLDSTVLLAALAAESARLGIGLRAVHVNHGLHADAPAWSQRCRDLAAGQGMSLVNVDATLIAEAPKVLPHREAMCANIAGALGIDPGRVNVKATTTEGCGMIGRSEGIGAMAAVLIEPVPRERDAGT